MTVKCPVCGAEYDCPPGKYQCVCGAKFYVAADGRTSTSKPGTSTERSSQHADAERTVTPRRREEAACTDADKTVPPLRHEDGGQREAETFDPDRTIPGSRVRRAQGELQTGDVVLDRYELLEKLGSGAMGVVFKCKERVSGVEYALKMVPPELARDTNAMEDVLENFRLVHSLKHPNIAGVDFLERDEYGAYFLIMEYAWGESLARWIKRKWKEGRPELNEVVSIVRQIASALDYAHSQQVLHRDIKPANVMIDENGNVKVLDFGLASKVRSTMTALSVDPANASGTPNYLSPEQFKGKYPGPAADQYALGVLAYQMLSGRLPFDSDDFDVLRAAVTGEIPDPVSGISDRMNRCLRKVLSKAPRARFRNCAEFADELTAAAEASRISGAGFRDRLRADRRLRRNISVAGLGIIVAAAAFVLAPAAGVPVLIGVSAMAAAVLFFLNGGRRRFCPGASDAEPEQSVASAPEIVPDAGKGLPERPDLPPSSGEKTAPTQVPVLSLLFSSAPSRLRRRLPGMIGAGVIALLVATALLLGRYSRTPARPLAPSPRPVSRPQPPPAPEPSKPESPDSVAKEELKQILRGAEAGRPEAQFKLGQLLLSGRNGVGKSPEAAVSWFRKAAGKGHPGAQTGLGLCRYYGLGVGKDLDLAVEWFRKAAGQGYAEAQCCLGECYESGRGVEKNPAEAVRWYVKAAEQRDLFAQNDLGLCFYHGTGVEKDPVRAVQWFRKAAEEGHAGAQSNLGMCYEFGRGVGKDLAEADKWYSLSNSEGRVPRQKRLSEPEL